MKHFVMMVFALLGLTALPAKAQLFYEAAFFSDDDWDNQHTFVMGKWSQLFYELNIGITGSRDEYADFVYFSVGYGKPTTKNAWRKFLPKSQQAAPTSKEEMKAKIDDTTSGLHAGTIGIGWKHYFTHWIGFHVQAGWGFIADLGGGNSSATSTNTDAMEEEDDSKSTFIYNSVPVQAGVDFCFLNNLLLSAGVSYMWKEIPIITLGLGLAF